MNTTPSQLDGRTFAIGVLSITACILLATFLLMSSSATPAYGFAQHDRGGDYIMLTQQLTSSNEGLVVIDAASQRLNLYAFDFNRKQLKILHRGIELDLLPGRKGREPKGGAGP